MHTYQTAFTTINIFLSNLNSRVRLFQTAVYCWPNTFSSWTNRLDKSRMKLRPSDSNRCPIQLSNQWCFHFLFIYLFFVVVVLYFSTLLVISKLLQSFPSTICVELENILGWNLILWEYWEWTNDPLMYKE